MIFNTQPKEEQILEQFNISYKDNLQISHRKINQYKILISSKIKENIQAFNDITIINNNNTALKKILLKIINNNQNNIDLSVADFILYNQKKSNYQNNIKLKKNLEQLDTIFQYHHILLKKLIYFNNLLKIKNKFKKKLKKAINQNKTISTFFYYDILLEELFNNNIKYLDMQNIKQDIDFLKTIFPDLQTLNYEQCKEQNNIKIIKKFLNVYAAHFKSLVENKKYENILMQQIPEEKKGLTKYILEDSKDTLRYFSETKKQIPASTIIINCKQILKQDMDQIIDLNLQKIKKI